MTLTIETVDSMPAVKRGGGRRSEDREQIQTLLRTYKTQKISGVEVGKSFNALQQRIRTAAKKIDMNVQIVFQKNDDGKTGDLYFVGFDPAKATKATKAVAKKSTK